ncbi:MAG: PAS domain-containing protein [Alphaproteobacteria bacterium]
MEAARGELSPLILFEVRHEPVGEEAAIESAPDDGRRRLVELERELAAMRESLQQADEELQLLLDNVPAGVMIRNRSGRILKVNAGSAKFLNRPIDQIEGRNLGDFGLPGAILEEDRQVIDSGRPLLNVVHQIDGRDGQPLWLRMDRMPFLHRGTGEICVYALAENMTDTQKARQALTESEERFELALRGSDLGIWDWDLVDGTVFWSSRCLGILDIDRTEFAGMQADFWDRIHPDDKDRVEAARTAHFDKGAPYIVHYRIRRKDGSYRWIETRGKAVRNEKGRPVRFLGSADDITDRRRGELALKEKTEQMALAETIGGIGHWRIDLVENSLFWSDQVVVIHGEDPATFRPDLERAIEYYHPDDRAMVQRCVEDGMTRGQPFEFEARIVRRSGEVRVVHSICRVERDRDGKVTVLFGVFADITERREREKERQKTLDELYRSNAELSRFSYVCSHDLKEPVRTLGNLAELLLDEEQPVDDAERRDLLTRIHKNAQRMSVMIESLLAFSRADGTLTTEPVDLNETMEEVRDNLSAAIEQAKAEIEIGGLPTLSGARVHFRQLFQNLIGNALKFGRPGDCRVEISCRDEGDFWSIAVDDNGPGVPEGAREEIFQVFKRLHRRDDVPGTGLGLSICKKILKQYRGMIRCDRSALGGASMIIRLPKESS